MDERKKEGRERLKGGKQKRRVGGKGGNSWRKEGKEGKVFEESEVKEDLRSRKRKEGRRKKEGRKGI